MKLGKAFAIGGAFVVAALIFFLGRLFRPTEDWARQYINSSDDPKTFRNSFHGLQISAPAGSDWQLVWEPAKMRPTPGGVNKVLEINRLIQQGESDKDWARMDVFVEPLAGGIPVNTWLRKIEFREMRAGFKVISDEEAVVGGLVGRARVAGWAVERLKFRTVNSYIEHNGKLFAFIGVTGSGVSDRYRPTFEQIVAGVRLD